eukprot:g5389.t1 g5389   contig2:444531-445223(-)
MIIGRNNICLVAALLLVGSISLQCSGFVPIAISRRMVCKPIQSKSFTVLSEEKPSEISGIDSILDSSVPDIDVLVDEKNTKVGERGEAFVLVQGMLFLFITIGTVPLFGDFITTFLGPSLLMTGLLIVYKSGTDLKNNLSHWATPTEQGSLVDTGIYGMMRHPMYTGVLLIFLGLSVATDSAMRMLLTAALYLLLDAKSNYEETKLAEAYGEEYEEYKVKVANKFFPEFN